MVLKECGIIPVSPQKSFSLEGVWKIEISSCPVHLISYLPKKEKVETHTEYKCGKSAPHGTTLGLRNDKEPEREQGEAEAELNAE